MKRKKGFEDGICEDPDHPEYHGQPCSCAGCRPVNVCVEDGGCYECDGPSVGCDPSEADEEDAIMILCPRLKHPDSQGAITLYTCLGCDFNSGIHESSERSFTNCGFVGKTIEIDAIPI